MRVRSEGGGEIGERLRDGGKSVAGRCSADQRKDLALYEGVVLIDDQPTHRRVGGNHGHTYHEECRRLSNTRNTGKQGAQPPQRAQRPQRAPWQQRQYHYLQPDRRWYNKEEGDRGFIPQVGSRQNNRRRGREDRPAVRPFSRRVHQGDTV